MTSSCTSKIDLPCKFCDMTESSCKPTYLALAKPLTNTKMKFKEIHKKHQLFCKICDSALNYYWQLTSTGWSGTNQDLNHVNQLIWHWPLRWRSIWSICIIICEHPFVSRKWMLLPAQSTFQMSTTLQNIYTAIASIHEHGTANIWLW